MDPVILISVFGALSGCLYLGYRVGHKRGHAAGYAEGRISGLSSLKKSVRRESTPNSHRARPQPRKESEEPAWMG